MTDRCHDHHGDTVIFVDRPPRLLPARRDLVRLRLVRDLSDRISPNDPYAPLAFGFGVLRVGLFAGLPLIAIGCLVSGLPAI